MLRSWLFPPACAACDAPGVALCAACAPSPRDAIAFAVDGVPAFALGAYEGALRKAIVAMKHGERDPLDAFAALLAERAPLHGVLVPLSTTRPRAAERGFDQSVELARRIAARTGVPYATLLRKHGAPQDGRARLARLRSAGRFRLVALPPLPATVTLLDDVCTTGATLRDAMRTLAGAGVCVRQIVVVARTPPGRGRSDAGPRAAPG
ncbi:MAG: ComF family protein [Candidatus Eremiobacteraeota bacterium]|nr:ComF family protein [Candidatus Eremiobacteraeota bacterium]